MLPITDQPIIDLNSKFTIEKTRTNKLDEPVTVVDDVIIVSRIDHNNYKRKH